MRVAVVASMLAMCSAFGITSAASAGTLQPGASGEIDCNGQSLSQLIVKRSFLCTDIRGYTDENQNNWDNRFWDNGLYIGHDEPDMTFLSNRPGSGNDVTWSLTIPRDPSALPTDKSPGHDVVHWFELSPAPWFSMAMCDPNSYPVSACTPNSDSNAPTCVGASTTNCSLGGGSAFMEMQLYPPGNPPWVDSASCNDHSWCSALTIDSLECTTGFAVCNGGCEEPVNFAWISRDGAPSGPPNPQNSDLASDTPNNETLMMNPGDSITIHMSDAPVPGGGGQRAFEVVIHDWTTGQTGWMQASAQNGFASTSGGIVNGQPGDCSGTPYNFQPEFSTASAGNYVSWAALQTNISTEFETGHWEPCTSLSDPMTFSQFGIPDQSWNECNGPYEAAAGDDSTANGGAEAGDAYCYPAGDTHGALNSQPDEATGCQDDVFQNGDLDFDGNPYYADWPVSPYPTQKLPGSFVEQLPTTGYGDGYPKYFVQTDIALSESQCAANSPTGCTVPPVGPGNFYPYWSRVGGFFGCTLEFGNVSNGFGVNDLGGDAQYGSDQVGTLGYDEFEGPVTRNSCNGR